MAVEESKTIKQPKKETVTEVSFKCRLCEKEKPISDMKLISRFRPVVVVCRDCEKSLR
jgi:transcription elongation factor Elf1